MLQGVPGVAGNAPHPITITTGAHKMANGREEALDMFCTALEMKRKKQDLYDKSMKGCGDEVGKETFRLLRDAEREHGKQLQAVHDEMKKGSDWADACRYYPESHDELISSFRDLAARHAEEVDVEACRSDIGAIETGMELEDKCVRFFQDKLKTASGELERRFLENMVSEEREHYRTLADLKYYYTDPQGWMMEKSGARLDGAGGAA